MDGHLVTYHDLMEEVRLKIHEYSLDKVKEIFLERNGEMSVIKKEEQMNAECFMLNCRLINLTSNIFFI